jgi:hypothetical protein
MDKTFQVLYLPNKKAVAGGALSASRCAAPAEPSASLALAAMEEPMAVVPLGLRVALPTTRKYVNCPHYWLHRTMFLMPYMLGDVKEAPNRCQLSTLLAAQNHVPHMPDMLGDAKEAPNRCQWSTLLAAQYHVPQMPYMLGNVKEAPNCCNGLLH